MNKASISLFIWAILLILAQVLVFNRICLFGVAVPFVFLYILIKLPITLSREWMSTIGFTAAVRKPRRRAVGPLSRNRITRNVRVPEILPYVHIRLLYACVPHRIVFRTRSAQARFKNRIQHSTLHNAYHRH